MLDYDLILFCAIGQLHCAYNGSLTLTLTRCAAQHNQPIVQSADCAHH